MKKIIPNLSSLPSCEEMVMQPQHQKSMAGCFLVGLATVVVLFYGCCKSTRDDHSSVAGPRNTSQVQRIRASHMGFLAFSSNYGWEIEISLVEKSGRLTTYGSVSKRITAPIVRDVTFSTEQIKRLEDAIIGANFSDFPEEMGKYVMDTSIREISVESGRQNKSVKIYYYFPPDGVTSQVKSALKLWAVIRSMVDDENAMDYRSIDQELINGQK